MMSLFKIKKLKKISLKKSISNHEKALNNIKKKIDEGSQKRSLFIGYTYHLNVLEYQKKHKKLMSLESKKELYKDIDLMSM